MLVNCLKVIPVLGKFESEIFNNHDALLKWRALLSQSQISNNYNVKIYYIMKTADVQFDQRERCTKFIRIIIP